MKPSQEARIHDVLLDWAKQVPSISVSALVTRATQAVGVPRYRVARALYSLRAEGKVRLEDTHPPTTVLAYVQSHHGLWLWAILALIVVTAATVYLLPQDAPFIYVRYVLGSIFVLYLPGHTLIEALYPKKQDLTGLERLALSIGLSLALVPLIGLVLNYTPWGIRLDPILATLALVAMVLAVAATIRKAGYLRLASYPLTKR